MRLPKNAKNVWKGLKDYVKIWEPERRLPVKTYYKQRRLLIQRIIERHPGNLILDVGVGKGRFAISLSTRGYQCVGIDILKEMLDEYKVRAGQKLSQLNHPMLADAENLPFADMQFDVVLCVDTLHYIPNVWNALREMRRVCKKRGIIILDVPLLRRGEGRIMHSLYECDAFMRIYCSTILKPFRIVLNKFFGLPDISSNIKMPSKAFTMREIKEMIKDFHILHMYIHDNHLILVLKSRINN